MSPHSPKAKGWLCARAGVETPAVRSATAVTETAQARRAALGWQDRLLIARILSETRITPNRHRPSWGRRWPGCVARPRQDHDGSVAPLLGSGRPRGDPPGDLGPLAHDQLPLDARQGFAAGGGDQDRLAERHAELPKQAQDDRLMEDHP